MIRSLLTLLFFASLPARAGEVMVAVASNFAPALPAIAAAFAADTGHELNASAASTGKHYAQIVNGAPFDVFLAADDERPARLEADGRALPGSRRTYAIGRLVLWSRDGRLAGRDCRDALQPGFGGRIAIANPDTAPYGAAARAYLVQAGLWESVRERLLTAENVSQALQFAAAGGATAGFVAASLTALAGLPDAACTYDVPPGLHAPIEQQAVLLARAASNPAASEFLDWLGGERAGAIIRRYGYRLPRGTDEGD